MILLNSIWATLPNNRFLLAFIFCLSAINIHFGQSQTEGFLRVKGILSNISSTPLAINCRSENVNYSYYLQEWELVSGNSSKKFYSFSHRNDPNWMYKWSQMSDIEECLCQGEKYSLKLTHFNPWGSTMEDSEWIKSFLDQFMEFQKGSYPNYSVRIKSVDELKDKHLIFSLLTQKFIIHNNQIYFIKKITPSKYFLGEVYQAHKNICPCVN